MEERNGTVLYQATSPEIDHLCKNDKRLALVVERYGDLSYTLHKEGFAFIVETIVGQMLSNKAADVISARLFDLCHGNLTVAAINSLDNQAIRGAGLSNQKAEYIKGFAERIEEDPGFFMRIQAMDDKEIINRMTSVRGIGMWSAKMYLIFVLNRLDVLPFEDGAFLQSYKWLYATEDTKPSSINRQCEHWKPYSSLAARYLYRALDSGLVQNADLSKVLSEYQ